MKISGLLISAVIITLALQGCATSGNVQNTQKAPSTAAAQTTSAAVSQTSAATGPVVTSVNTKSDFEAVQAAINQQMQPGGRFGSVDSAGRATVSGRFEDMASLFDQYGSFDKMGPDARARINGDQNAINAVLAAHDGNRLICHDEMPVGSHLPKRVCRSLSEIQNAQNNANELMRRMQNSGSYNTMNGGH
jgi:hypothetical protein